MKYLLFNWDCVDNVDDPSKLTDKEFEDLAEKHGMIINSCEDFESQFNSEHFGTATHQLRIIKNDESEKTSKINYIQSVIQRWGATSSFELELDGSPCISSTGSNKNNTSQLVERFNLADVLVVIYNNETEIDENNVDYEELPNEIIDEICGIMEDYEADQLQTEKRCAD